MMRLRFFLLFLCLVFPARVRAQTEPEALWEKAMTEARQGNYGAAIPLFEKVTPLFLAKGQGEKAYASGALAIFLQEEKAATEQKPRREEGMRVGWILTDPRYSGNWIAPPVKNLSYGGLLILAREIRRVSFGENRSMPVWALLDIKVLPPFKKGETFLQSVCRLSPTGPLDGNLAALVSTQGRENEETWKGARLAYRFNSQTNKIEEVPPAEIFCQTETLGLYC